MNQPNTSRISIHRTRMRAFWFLLAAVFVFPIGRAAAQSPPGPLGGAPPADTPPPQPAAKPRPAIGGKPNLSGVWILNKDESDDPRQKMQQAAGNSGGGYGGRGGGGGMGGGGPMGGGGGPMGGGPMGGGGMGGGRRGGGNVGGGQGGDSMINELSQLRIDQTETSAKISGSSGRVLGVYSSSDQSNSKPSKEDSSMPPVAQWQGDQLVTVVQGSRGGKTTRTFYLSSDSRQLNVNTRVENPRFSQPVTYQLVYDLAPAGDTSR